MSQVLDVGVRITIEIQEAGAALDISTATVKRILIRKPDETLITATATFTTDGTEGLIYYDTVSGDFDQVGLYKVQGYIEMGGGTFYGTSSSFRVNCNI